MAAGKDLRADAVLAKCDECGAPLLGQCVFVEGRRVHRACFKCAGCGVNFCLNCLKPYSSFLDWDSL